MDALDLDTKISLQDGALTVNRSQDCTPIAEYAKARQNEGHHGSKDMRLAASIPFVMIEKYCNDNGVLFHEFMGNEEHIRRVCNDPVNAHFRIWPGRI